MNRTPTHLFIYGTLIPGEERWHFLEPYVAAGSTPTQDRAHGHLYDTGHGYPAALFDATNSIVDQMEGLVIELDEATWTQAVSDLEAARALVRDADLIWFGGGSQSRLTIGRGD